MRRTLQVTIGEPNRDMGKVFVITEMPADQGERWANRLIFKILTAHARLSQDARESGMAGLSMMLPRSMAASVRWLAGLSYDHEVEALLVEQMHCVTYNPPAPLPAQALLPGAASQVQEISTFWELRAKWLELHLGFLLAAGASTTESDPSPAPPAS